MGRGKSAKTQATGAGERRHPATQLPTAREASRIVAREAERVAELGLWPEYIESSMLCERVPWGHIPGPGFDAGIACALDLIPRDRQRLSATLHAAYTPEAVDQVRRETKRAIDPDSESAWWLAACNVCREGRLTEADFEAQLRGFEVLRNSPFLRREAAVDELSRMYQRFRVRDDGVAYSTVDGGMQGAYLAGHEVAVMHAPDEDLYFIGTYTESLGLDGFEWGSELDDLDRPRSGPVHGSRQFVKCHDATELEAALAIVKERFAIAGLTK